MEAEEADLERRKVPGGWIYFLARVSHLNALSLCYVPDPDEWCQRIIRAISVEDALNHGAITNEQIVEGILEHEKRRKVILEGLKEGS